MVNKIKKKFLSIDYQVNLLRRMQNLKQKDMSVKDYTEEFYRVDIRSQHIDHKIARYLNGLKSRIQDEMSFMNIDSVEEAYQYALKAEEILEKGYEQRQRDQGGRFQSGKGRFNNGDGKFDNSI